MHRAAFLDRDGVINIDTGYVHRWEDFEFIKGVIEGLRTLQKMGFRLVIITNQSGIARGYYTINDVNTLSEKINEFLNSHGINLSAIYFCPHHPKGNIPEFTKECFCRKPSPGMILKACEDLNLDLNSSILIGDKLSDIEAANRAGLASAFLIGSKDNGRHFNNLKIDARFFDLNECAKFIKKRSDKA